MMLARAASDRALDDIAAPPPVAAIPGSSAAAIAQAQELTRHRAPDYGKLFTHLSRAVRQAILLETAIADGHTPNLHRPVAQPHPADLQRPIAQRHPAELPATPNPNTTRPDTPRRETLERLDCLLHAALDGELHIDDQLLTISQQFGLDRPASHAPTSQATASHTPARHPPAPHAPAAQVTATPHHPPGTSPPQPAPRRRW